MLHLARYNNMQNRSKSDLQSCISPLTNLIENIADLCVKTGNIQTQNMAGKASSTLIKNNNS